MSMNKELFYKEVLGKLKERYGSGWEIAINYIPQNNGIIRTAFNIREQGNIISPTIYAEDFYNMYEGGTAFDEIIESIVDVYNKSGADKMSFNPDVLADWNSIKNRLAVTVVNKKRNLHYLNKLVWREFLDLAVIPIICVDAGNTSLSSFKITKAIAAFIDVDEETIIDEAIKNNKKMFRTSCRDMIDVIAQMVNIEPDEEVPGIPMKVLTNNMRINGASTILDDEALKRLHTDWGRDFFILPSSVHELICIPVDDRPVKELQVLVKEVNSSLVSADEFLSDNIYLYDGNKVKLVISE